MTTIDTRYGAQTAGALADEALPAANPNQLSELENNFITLMVAQIQNQDPTKPIDSNEFLQQNAALSQVKSMENMASLAKTGLTMMDNVQMLTAANMAGQTVTVATNAVALGEEPVLGQAYLQHAAGSTVVTLTDANGKATQIKLGPQPAGPVEFKLDADKLGLPAGRYAVSLETDSGETPQVEVRGVVRNVRVGNDGPVLDVAGTGQVPFYNIVEFSRGA